MILALFGRSAAGKTTIAEIMAGRLQLPVRHCGIAVRAAATEFGSSLAELPEEVHRRVDQETLNWCDQHSAAGGIIEGRFLDSVLKARDDVLFVHIHAEISERVRRMIDRSAGNFSVDDVLAIDRSDDDFRASMYPAVAHVAFWEVETTGGTASLWAENLEQFARQNMKLALG